jgi:hypothetical protein
MLIEYTTLLSAASISQQRGDEPKMNFVYALEKAMLEVEDIAVNIC